MLTKEQAINSLKRVIDPELNLDIWTLGLIYKLEVNNKDVNIDMTFTSPMCPYGPMLVEQVKQELNSTGFSNTNIQVVFSPPWEPSQDLREALGV